jgi:hypothetical protein
MQLLECLINDPVSTGLIFIGVILIIYGKINYSKCPCITNTTDTIDTTDTADTADTTDTADTVNQIEHHLVYVNVVDPVDSIIQTDNDSSVKVWSRSKMKWVSFKEFKEMSSY